MKNTCIKLIAAGHFVLSLILFWISYLFFQLGPNTEFKSTVPDFFMLTVLLAVLSMFVGIGILRKKSYGWYLCLLFIIVSIGGCIINFCFSIIKCNLFGILYQPTKEISLVQIFILSSAALYFTSLSVLAYFGINKDLKFRNSIISIWTKVYNSKAYIGIILLFALISGIPQSIIMLFTNKGMSDSKYFFETGDLLIRSNPYWLKVYLSIKLFLLVIGIILFVGLALKKSWGWYLSLFYLIFHVARYAYFFVLSIVHYIKMSFIYGERGYYSVTEIFKDLTIITALLIIILLLNNERIIEFFNIKNDKRKNIILLIGFIAIILSVVFSISFPLSTGTSFSSLFM